jgi:hypothetical protein
MLVVVEAYRIAAVIKAAADHHDAAMARRKSLCRRTVRET